MRKLLSILMSVFMLAMLIPVSGMASNGIAETTIETNNTDGITLAGFASRKLTNGYTQDRSSSLVLTPQTPELPRHCSL